MGKYVRSSTHRSADVRLSAWAILTAWLLSGAVGLGPRAASGQPLGGGTNWTPVNPTGELDGLNGDLQITELHKLLGVRAFNPVEVEGELIVARVEAEGDKSRWVLERRDQITGDVVASVPLPVPDPVAGFPSADGRHVLISERLPRDGALSRYRWSIYSSSGTLAGAVENRQSLAPFIVIDGLLITESPAHGSRVDDRWIEESRKLVAIDLENGLQRWQAPIRDTAYRGPRRP